jgi:hypothetical protein
VRGEVLARQAVRSESGDPRASAGWRKGSAEQSGLHCLEVSAARRASAEATGWAGVRGIRLPVSQLRDVAQPGSAPEWGSGGRGFKSRRPD